ncbi:MAG: stage II sporulation protein D [Bacilli bacterium]
MKNNIIITLLILVVFYLVGSLDNKTSYFYNEEKETINVTNENNENVKININDYLIGVLACEMPASFEEEALKSQAIASRTFAYYLESIGKDITTDTSTQCMYNQQQMKEIWNDDYDIYYLKIKKAVEETENLLITYNGNIISSYYFAMSNGYTEDSMQVFNENKDYLKSVSSLDEIENNNFEKKVTFSQQEFCKKLNINCENIIINNISRSKSNRVNEITINNKTFKGTEFRKILNLRSTDFTINISNEVIITTHGYGHGVGMSQYGANYLAKKGYNYEQILKYYYQGVNITSII